VVLYEMVAGCPPFDGPTSSDLIVSILDREPVPLLQLAPAIPTQLQRIIKKALCKDREKRYQTVKDLALDLENLRSELEMGASPERSSAAMGGESAPRSSPQIKESGEIRLSSAAYIAAGIKQHSRQLLFGMAVIVLAITAFSYFYFGRTGKSTIDSIAVLPFANVGADPNTEYLSDGITETITNSISQLPNLSVIAHSSVFRYKGREVDPQTAGRELGVRAVLTGKITPRSDDLLISVELVDCNNNHQIWGEQYDRKLSDILAVQSEISREISEKLRLRLTGEEQKRVTRHYTEDTEAYQAYLKGRYYWNKRTGDDLKKSTEYFNQAIAKDPGYALAYAGLADCYIVIPNYTDIPAEEAYLKAKAAALKALEIDDTLAEAHASLGGVKADYDWDFAGAESELKRAIELNPNYATAHHWYAQFLSGMGRHQEAIAEIKRAQELDPLSLIIDSVVGDTYVKARQYDLAIEQLRKTIEMDKNFVRAHRYLEKAYVAKGMYDEAITEYQTAATLAGEDSETAAKRATALRAAYAASGVRGYWQKQLDLLKEDPSQGNMTPYGIAGIYARLGDKDETFNWLEKAYREHDPYIIYLKTGPEFDALRSDPRTIDLMRRIGLPQ